MQEEKMAYSFQAKIAARGCHFCCAIIAMVDKPPRLKTVGHVPREISRHIFFFLKEENGKVDGFIYSTQYQPSPIPAGGLEIPLKLTFKSPSFITHQKMKDFITNLYSYITRQKQKQMKTMTLKFIS